MSHYGNRNLLTHFPCPVVKVKIGSGRVWGSWIGGEQQGIPQFVGLGSSQAQRRFTFRCPPGSTCTQRGYVVPVPLLCRSDRPLTVAFLTSDSARLLAGI